MAGTGIRVQVGDRECHAEWIEENPDTREAITAALPLAGDARKWGKELYFRTDVNVAGENGQTEVPVGSIAYWPQGNAVCLFWGPTPASHGEEPRATAPVTVVARITDTAVLEGATDGTGVRLSEP